LRERPRGQRRFLAIAKSEQVAVSGRGGLVMRELLEELHGLAEVLLGLSPAAGPRALLRIGRSLWRSLVALALTLRTALRPLAFTRASLSERHRRSGRLDSELGEVEVGARQLVVDLRRRHGVGRGRENADGRAVGRLRLVRL